MYILAAEAHTLSTYKPGSLCSIELSLTGVVGGVVF